MRTLRHPPRHPGRILEEDFLSRIPGEFTQAELAGRLAMSRPRLNDLIHGRRSVSLDTALRLARCFGNSAEFWLQAQSDWDLYQARRVRAQMRESDRIEPIPLREEAAEEPEVEETAPVAPRAPAAENGGSSVYYEEFLLRRGLLEEARRFARIQMQLDALEPNQPEARSRLQQAIKIVAGAGIPTRLKTPIDLF